MVCRPLEFPDGNGDGTAMQPMQEARDVGSILGQEDPLEKEMVTCSSIPRSRNLLLDNSTDRGAWWAMVHGVAKSEND